MSNRLDIPIVICPGMARSGTTYLYFQLTNGGNRELFNVPDAGKETNYFTINIHADNRSFISMFRHFDSRKPSLDFSPAYLWVGSGAIDRICASTTTANTKIILNLRSLVDQAFSHYLHDLKIRVASSAPGSDVTLSFFAESAQKRYLKYYYRNIKALVDTYTRERIFVINFYKDFDDLDNLRDRLSRFLNVRLQPFTEERIGEGGWLPYYIYGGARDGAECVMDGEIRVVPHGSLLLVNGDYSHLWQGVSAKVGCEMVLQSSSWTKMLHESESSLLRGHVFKNDFLETLSLLGEDPSQYDPEAKKIAQPAELDLTTFRALPLRNTLLSRATKCIAFIEHCERTLQLTDHTSDPNPNTQDNKVTREEIIYAYRLFLGRDPENEAVIESRLSIRSWHELRALFLRSAEFVGKVATELGPAVSNEYLLAAPNHVDTHVPEADFSRLVAHVQGSWEVLGGERPHWSVITDPKFLPENITSNLETFYRTGEDSFRLFEAAVVRGGARLLGNSIVLELGCGVGRVTAQLARRFERVVGYDVSLPHLAIAREHLGSRGIENVELRHMRNLNDLMAIEPFDIFYSVIVLQHNPPPLMYKMLEIIFEKTKPEGIVYFQIPVAARGYEFDINKYLKDITNNNGRMEMHLLPQRVLFALLETSAFRILDLQRDNWTGPGFQSISILAEKIRR